MNAKIYEQDIDNLSTGLQSTLDFKVDNCGVISSKTQIVCWKNAVSKTKIVATNKIYDGDDRLFQISHIASSKPKANNEQASFSTAKRFISQENPRPIVKPAVSNQHITIPNVDLLIPIPNSYHDYIKKYNEMTRFVSIYTPRYMEYKKKWMEILNSEKQKFNQKWGNCKSSQNLRITDFDIKRTLGSGSFGRVLLVKHKESNNYFAMKLLKKSKVIELRQKEHTLNEKNVISSVSSPFITKFICSFKDNSNLYIVLEFVNGGEMFKHLSILRQFSEELTKFYCAQAVLAIEYLHSLDIVHRDIKPENTLISSDGYIKLTDFGFAKYLTKRTYTMCGTPEYLAPEIIQLKAYGKAVDWWSIGILTYECSTGKPPFQETDVTKRYGNLRYGADDIKTHKWFSNTDWLAIYNKKVRPPLIPNVRDPHDTKFFDICKEERVTISDRMMYEREFESF